MIKNNNTKQYYLSALALVELGGALVSNNKDFIIIYSSRATTANKKTSLFIIDRGGPIQIRNQGRLGHFSFVVIEVRRPQR